MKKRKFLRLSKRIMILALCTCLISGSCFQRYKITANAAAMTATLTAYSASEICIWIASTLLACFGIKIVTDNQDQLIELGKKFIDSCDLSELSGWCFTKADTTGQSYVYGSEALEEIQDMTFEVIQGGGNSPENNDDNDGDGDVDADDRAVELKNLGLWATSSFTNWFCEQVQPLLDKAQAGEENIFAEVFPLNDYCFRGYETDADGNVIIRAFWETYIPNGIYYDTQRNWIEQSFSTSDKWSAPFGFVNGSNINIYYFNGSSIGIVNCSYTYETLKDGVHYKSGKGKTGGFSTSGIYSCNIPIFTSKEVAKIAFETGDFSEALNLPKTYQIADWLQESWASAIGTLHGGIHSLGANVTAVGEAANLALQNQLNGLGYIEALAGALATTAPLGLPGTIADPIYYPATSTVPKLAPEELPWYVPATDPDAGPEVNPDSGDNATTDDPDSSGKDPKSKFGLNMIFGILILLIMIIIMLLIIFISCLAFIVMVFRIEATTGFLPDDMVAALDYLRTLQIPGFGMSVYDFFMALIYIILIFSVIGILRKNIDKIKFPRPKKR